MEEDRKIYEENMQSLQRRLFDMEKKTSSSDKETLQLQQEIEELKISLDRTNRDWVRFLFKLAADEKNIYHMYRQSIALKK
jgi:peptidoglycan hydrolase CwlO-like protein